MSKKKPTETVSGIDGTLMADTPRQRKARSKPKKRARKAGAKAKGPTVIGAAGSAEQPKFERGKHANAKEAGALTRDANPGSLGPQSQDNKQRRTMGVVARGNFVKDDSGYKGPGEFVTASAEEIERLRVKGVLVDEGRIAMPLGVSGPSVLREDAASKGVQPT